MIRCDGFVLADNLVALVLISLVVSLFCFGEQQLHSEMMHAKQELNLARMAKEASTQIDESHPSVSYTQDGYQIQASHHEVSIEQRHLCVFRVMKQ